MRAPRSLVARDKKGGNTAKRRRDDMIIVGTVESRVCLWLTSALLGRLERDGAGVWGGALLLLHDGFVGGVY